MCRFISEGKKQTFADRQSMFGKQIDPNLIYGVRSKTSFIGNGYLHQGYGVLPKEKKDGKIHGFDVKKSFLQ